MLTSSSRPEVFCKKVVLRYFAKFTGKHLCQGLFFNKRLWHRCFPVNVAKFLRKPFLTERLWWLLLSYAHLNFFVTRKWQKVQIIIENILYWRRKYLLKDLITFNKIFRENLNYGIIKSQKKRASPLSLEIIIMEKSEGGLIDP